MPNTTTQAIILKDFTGGLWLNEGEPPDNSYASFMENMDILPGGGLQKRAPVRLNYKKSSTELVLTSSTMFPIMVADPSTLGRYVILDIGSTQAPPTRLVCFTTGSSTAVWNPTVTAGGSMIAFGASDAGAHWYVHGSATVINRVTTGGVATALGVAFNDNLSAPTNGNMPKSYMGTQHFSAYYFIAYTQESATDHSNRIRWSHPGRFEDWRTNDKLDVGDGSPIIGLYSVGETLLIVKATSVWVLTGFDPDSFQLRKIADYTNAIAGLQFANNASACTHAQYGAFISLAGQGVFHWDGKTWTDISGGLKDAIRDGRIIIRHMAVVGGVLYCSGNAANFIGEVDTIADKSWEYDLAYKHWTQHNASFRGLCSVSPNATGAPRAYAVIGDFATPSSYSFAYYRQSIAAGSWCDNTYGTDVDIVCQYRSPWQDAKNPARKKRWRRPWIVFNKRPNASATDPTNYTMAIFKDWDGVHPTKSSTFSAVKATDTTDYSALYGYGHATTGSDYDQGGAFAAPGSGYAMQILLSSTGTPKDQWGFDSVTFKYVNRSLR